MFNLQQHNKQCEEEFDEKFNYLYGAIYVDKHNGKEPITTHDLQKEIKSFITTSNTTILKKFLESERGYWVKIFDNPPERKRVVESDEWTRNIARLEIDRIDNLLEKLK